MSVAIEGQEIEFLSRKILDLNKQLMESEKGKSRFLSLIANKLNNPMAAFLGLIPHLKSTIGEEEIFRLIHQEALNLHFCIDNLVAASEIESGAFEIMVAMVYVDELLYEVIRDLNYVVNERNMILAIHNNLTIPVAMDPRKLSLILKNLIANACQYGTRNTIVEISMDQQDSVMVISVTNHGNGPDVKFKPQVFTRFAQGPEGEHGLGIGLSIVRELCEQMDGSIDYTVGEGHVTFSVSMPISDFSSELVAFGSNEIIFEPFSDTIEL
jgi:signal transduction histidine kinase